MASSPNQPFDRLHPSPDWVGARVPQTRMASIRSILPLASLIYVCLVFPPEVAFNAGGLNLTAYRIALAVLIGPAVLSYVKGETRFSLPDALVFVGSLWMIIAFINLFGPVDGVIRSLAIVLDALGAFLVARTSLRSHDDFRRLLVIVAPAFFLAGLILAVESIFHTIIYRPFFAQFFGNVQMYEAGNAVGGLEYRTDQRAGLMRAYSTFSHPIHAGVTLSSLLPLYYFSGIRGWPRWVGIGTSFLGIFSVSSVSFLVIAIGAGMIAVDVFKRRLRYVTWPVISAILGGILAALHIGSQSGVIYLIIRYTFSPHNGYVRITQWETALKAMSDRPWFGWGYDPIPLPIWLPPSIDAHFLALGLRSGVITAILLYAAAIFCITLLGSRVRFFDEENRNLMVGLNISVFLLLFASLTVTYFGETNIYFMAVLGIIASFCQVAPKNASARNSRALAVHSTAMHRQTR
ncbi:O-antigen ligase family protein [Erythrobacter sp. MTPC3]|uniref:O-antigen ligase family protein n=1 Tax=Erythrobacter sp. MTPC3 TaxID=3056564 RepID=UPI0036F1E38E